jgi:sulfate adenylyltransferase (ADP) / ATP adenylyltransferase
VLNKYPVISRHSILTTIGFKKQTDFLESQDLDVTYSCLQAWEAESTEASPSRLFAFFNSGEHSGASQPHRHLQILPVEDMVDPGSPRIEWQPLIDVMTEPLPDHPSILSNPSLPFCHYAMRIPENPDAGVLQRIYRYLYDYASKSVQSWNEGRALEKKAVDNNRGEASISYNLAMTTNAMAICPRRTEIATIPTTRGEGCAAVNGTILGGTLMVKEKSEWDALSQGQVTIDDVLAEIGIPYLSDSKDRLSTHL